MNRKVLVIDDEPDICDMIKDYLSDKDLMVFTAYDAEKGLEILALENPSLVLLDVLLPKVGGLECLNRIKARSQETIVVMLTGMKDERTAKEAIKRGAYDYITKPFDMDRFEQNVLNRLF